MSELSTGMEKKKIKHKKRRRAAFRAFMFLVILLLMVVCSIMSYNYVTNQQNNKTKVEVPEIPEKERIEFEVPKGATTTSIANSLEEVGVIKYPFIFKLVSKVNGFDGTYRAGTHIISNKLNYDQIMMALSSEPVSIRVTIPEGMTVKQAIEKIISTNSGLINRDKFVNVMNTEKFDYKFVENLPKREHKLEGYLFPDTYFFDLKVGEKAIISEMLRNFDTKFKPEYYKKAEELKMSMDQVVILASLIEREARHEEDRKMISGVFHNRLKSKDMTLRKLQSCATLQYIFLNREGKVKEKLYENDTKIQDPYNTYLYEGLPPGPICSPGQASIEAALYPEKTDYMYFVAKDDGYHKFSKTYKDHQAAINKYGLK